MSERFFASDNSATVHPAVMDALHAANRGHAIAYGDDDHTRRAERTLKAMFGDDAEVFFVYNGTGANVLGIQAALAPYHAVICADGSHINMDECGALERHAGAKLLSIPASDGRISPEQIVPLLSAAGVVHHSQPRVVSITQATEVGTVYQPSAVRELAELCHKNNLILHMDGARVANAAVTLGADPGEITGPLGVDMLSLGGTKNGLMFGEAIIVWNRELAEQLHYIRKQGMHLASKMRFIAVQFEVLFGTNLWRENAEHANGLARDLASRLRTLPGVEIVHPVEANGVFARLPHEAIEAVQNEMFFYMWDAREDIVRLMVSFDSTLEDVEAFEALVRRHVR